MSEKKSKLKLSGKIQQQQNLHNKSEQILRETKLFGEKRLKKH